MLKHLLQALAVAFVGVAPAVGSGAGTDAEGWPQQRERLRAAALPGSGGDEAERAAARRHLFQRCLDAGELPPSVLPSPHAAGAWTTRDRLQLRRDFFERALLGGCRRLHGRASTRPDVETFLRAFADDAAWNGYRGEVGPPPPDVPLRGELADLAEAALAAGGRASRDPYLRVVAGLLWAGSRDRREEGLRLLRANLHAAIRSRWHPLLRATALAHALDQPVRGADEAAMLAFANDPGRRAALEGKCPVTTLYRSWRRVAILRG